VPKVAVGHPLAVSFAKVTVPRLVLVAVRRAADMRPGILRTLVEAQAG
jgi:hypothetical protein